MHKVNMVGELRHVESYFDGQISKMYGENAFYGIIDTTPGTDIFPN